MNYPLAEAIMAFAGGPSLDMDVVRSHHEYGLRMGPLDGAGFADKLQATLDAYDPAIVTSQLNLLSSHDAPRMRTVMGDDDAAVRLATILQMTLPGAPSIYYGDEIGLAGGNDPACRGAFPWDREAWDEPLLAFVRALIRLRTAEPALRHGTTRVIAADGDAVAIERRIDGRTIVVAVNAGPSDAALRFGLVGVSDGALEDLIATDRGAVDVGPDGTLVVRLGARSARILGRMGD